MARTIYKFQLGPVTYLDLPIGSDVLTVATQDGEPHLWVELDHPYDGPTIHRTFAAHGTGHPLPDDHAERLIYIGTCHGVASSLVMHIYEVLR